MKLSRHRAARRQRGVVLFIALIVLVAMALAGVAMMRSVDTTLGVAGNLAFKQAAVLSTDQGVSTAYVWINANPGAALQNDDPGNGYFASFVQDPPTGWFDLANWGSGMLVNGGTPDAAGNSIRYIVHRMCSSSGAYNAGGQECALYTPLLGAAAGSTQSVGSYQFQGNPQVYLRVTTRVDGPKNTVSITQTSILIDAS